MAGNTTLRAVAGFSVYRPQSGWEMGVEKGATSDSIVVEPEHEQLTAYQLRYECLTTIMISADRGYNQITVLKQYCTINTYGGLSHPFRAVLHIFRPIGFLRKAGHIARRFSPPRPAAPRGVSLCCGPAFLKSPRSSIVYGLYGLLRGSGGLCAALGADLAQPACQNYLSF